MTSTLHADPDLYLKGLIKTFEDFADETRDLQAYSSDLSPLTGEEPVAQRLLESCGDLGYWWCRHTGSMDGLTRPENEHVFCMANIRVPPPLRGRGIFTGFLAHIILNPHHYRRIRVESVGNLEFCTYLRRRGFKDLDRNTWAMPTLQMEL